MRTLGVFDQVSLDGFFTDAKGDMGWAHKDDEQWRKYASENASGGGVLVLGRKTYEQMVSFWPTPEAKRLMPAVAKGMNDMEKIVFSRTLDKVSWQNTRLVKRDPVTEIRQLKQESGPNMMILGSGTIVSQLTEAGLIDAYTIVVVPVVLGSGRSLFQTVKQRLPMKLTSSRPFKNGNVVLDYEPSK